jgi:bifunctional DNA-binding transcriptional regulator/antitoxin component of YhaV-PrlF toxin-antitoxin module
MTIMMTGKNQITIPKQFVTALKLSQGALFDVRQNGNKLELVPLETVEKEFTDEEYAKMDEICARERHLAKPLTQEFIDRLKEGKV